MNAESGRELGPFPSFAMHSEVSASMHPHPGIARSGKGRVSGNNGFEQPRPPSGALLAAFVRASARRLCD